MATLEQLAELRRIYQAATLDLLAAVRAGRRGPATLQQRAFLRDVSRTLASLDAEAAAWVRRTVPAAYRRGRDAITATLERAGVPSTAAALPQLHAAAVEQLAAGLVADLHDAHRVAGRRVADAYRETTLRTLASTTSTGRARRDAANRTAAALARSGVTGFTDRAGRQWGLEAYAAMATRSTSAEAVNLGSLNQLREAGRSLVMIDSLAVPCPICAPYEGRVYSADGTDDRYPALWDTAFAGDFANIHPNCRHRLVAYVDELRDPGEIERDIERSNRPFVDDRPQAVRDAYAAGQTQKRQLRALRREHAELRAALGDRAPGSVSALAAMKRTNSDTYRALRADLRALRKAP